MPECEALRPCNIRHYKRHCSSWCILTTFAVIVGIYIYIYYSLNIKEVLPLWFCEFLGHSVDSLFPYFLAHARKVFPHLECIDDLRRISDLTQPHNWYAEARKLFRKVVFHAGLCNSSICNGNFLVILLVAGYFSFFFL